MGLSFTSATSNARAVHFTMRNETESVQVRHSHKFSSMDIKGGPPVNSVQQQQQQQYICI